MGVKIVILLSLQLLRTVLSKSVSKGNLQVEVTKEVKCKENQKAHEGDKVTVHYGGFLQDGKKFDSSFDRSQPFTFTMGVGQVIPGWDQGLLGVCAGEERHLVVPAPLAYGDRGAGDVIPPGATLLFDIVIVDVERADARQEEEQRRKQEEEAKRKKKEEEERKRIEAKKREEEEEERQRREEEERRKAEEEELRRKEQKRKQEEQRRKQQKRKEEEERKKIEEEIRRKEELVRKEEAKLRRQEEEKAQESQRRAEEEKEYKNGEDEYYYYEDYAPESSCEPGDLKMQVTHSPGRCGKIARAGDQLTMHYTGKLSSGGEFDWG